MNIKLKTLTLITTGLVVGVVVGRVSKTKINHYITKYEENNENKAEAWVQIDLLGKSYTLSKQQLNLD